MLEGDAEVRASVLSDHVDWKRDPNTNSNYHQFVTTKTTTNLTIDFDTRTLEGEVVLILQANGPNCGTEIILDTSFLEIQDVKAKDGTCKWDLCPREEPYGSPLKIVLAKAVEDRESVEIAIQTKTTSKCTALDWMTPTQSGTEYPYMYSQCQAIHARSMIPCQDTPDVKSIYEFHITSNLPVIASGLSTGVRQDGGSKVYSFRQDVPIPSNLFALASGDIQTAAIGPRSRVATTPANLAAAQWEFEACTERYIKALESIVYEYQWTEYNLLVLPPSFPYGGMENPVYTYLTPTTVSGDRENVDVVAHELSHSFSGNLVSTASWEHFWLNEGWTMYLERRLQAALYGEPHRDFSAIIGWKSLRDAIKEFGDDSNFSKLVPNLKGLDPDEAFSVVPYEKGYTFLSYLEAQIGRSKWNKYIPHYFTKFARKSLTTIDFKDDLFAFFAGDAEATAVLVHVDWHEWWYSTTLPPKPDFDTSLADVCYGLATKWEGIESSQFKPIADDISGWTSMQKVVFLDAVKDYQTALTADQAQLLGDVYGFASSTNVEVTSRYYTIGLRSRAQGVYDPTVKLLSCVGRMKFVRPLYKNLNEADPALAVATFEKNRDFYHPICRAQVERDLGMSK